MQHFVSQSKCTPASILHPKARLRHRVTMSLGRRKQGTLTPGANALFVLMENNVSDLREGK